MILARASSMLMGMRPHSVLALAMGLGSCHGTQLEPRRLPSADLVLWGGAVRTLDPGRPRAEAVAVREGRIIAVGSNADVRLHVGSTTRVVELAGDVVVPGLVDAHLHLEALGEALATLDLRGRGLSEALTAIRDAASERPPPRPLVGRGWDQNLWTPADCPFESGACLDDEGLPDRELLDRVAPGRVVVLTRVDGHALWVSSAALATAGLDSVDPDPPGGRAHRRRDGSLTGVLIDEAMAPVTASLPEPTPEGIEEALLRAQDHLLRMGLTGAHDLGMSLGAWAALGRLDARGKLRLRTHIYLWGNEGDLDALLTRALERQPREGPRHRLVGVKLMADGALGSRGAALLAPYADVPSTAGSLLLQREALAARMAIARRHGLQVATHAIGDLGNRVTLDAQDEVYGAQLLRERPRVEHAQVVHPDDQARLGASGAVASVQPIHVSSDLAWAGARLGAERLARAYPWRSLRAAGATLAAGSDAPVEPADPRRGLQVARTRLPPGWIGAPPPGWRMEERMDGESALRAFTVGAAWAVGAEHDLGRVSPGYRADLTVLSGDPVEVPPDQVPRVEVEMTIVGGEIVHVRR